MYRTIEKAQELVSKNDTELSFSDFMKEVGYWAWRFGTCNEKSRLMFMDEVSRLMLASPCPSSFCHSRPRIVEDGYVKMSYRMLYQITEEDILLVAEEVGVKLTEEQMDSLARRIVDGFDPEGNWREAVEDAMSESGIEVEA